MTALTQYAVIFGRCDGKIDAAVGENLELEQLCPNIFEHPSFPNTLQDLAQDEIGKSKTLALQFPIKPARFWIVVPAKVIDPDCRVDDNHHLFRDPPQARSPEIPLPADFAA